MSRPALTVIHTPATDLEQAAEYRHQARSMRKDADYYGWLIAQTIARPELGRLAEEYAAGLRARYEIHISFCLAMADKADGYAADLEAHAAGGAA